MQSGKAAQPGTIEELRQLTAARHCLETNDVGGLRELLAKGLSSEARLLPEHDSLLIAAIRANSDGPILSLLLAEGADPNDIATAGSFPGWTPLQAATHLFREQQVALLLSHGADPNREVSCDRLPLSLGLTVGSQRIVELLLEHRADVTKMNPDGSTPLIMAAAFGRADFIPVLLRRGAALEGTDNKVRATALLTAAAVGKADSLAALIAAGADIEATTADGFTALMLASHKGSWPCVQQLLEAGAQANRVTQDQVDDCPKLCGAAGMAAAMGHGDVVKRLLLAGANGAAEVTACVRVGDADVDSLCVLLDAGAPHQDYDENGVTPLAHCAIVGAYKCAQTLLKAGADPNAVTTKGITPLIFASRRGRVAFIDLLRQHGARLEFENENAQATSLLMAAKEGHADAVTALLTFQPPMECMVSARHFAKEQGHFEAAARLDQAIETVLDFIEALQARDCARVAAVLQAKPDAVRLSGSLGLRICAQEGRLDLSRALLEAGADANHCGCDDGPPLFIAVVSDNPELVRLFLAAGAQVNPRNKNGETPLLWAVSLGKLAAAQVLLDAGAEVDLGDKRGFTPLQRAVCEGPPSAIPLLLAAGAFLERSNNVGESALFLAAENGRIEQLELLLAAGAELEAASVRVDDRRGPHSAESDTPGLETPLLAAARMGHHAVVAALLKAGARIDARNELGESALEVAKRRKDDKLRELLESLRTPVASA